MTLKQFIYLLPRLVKYNLKIIFAGKFIWFLLAAFLFFAYFMFQIAWSRSEVNEGVVYNLLMFPCVLLVFYPAVFGIQNDEDSRILEILFGIPDYKYKVWGVRLLMIYVAIFVILIVFSWLATLLLYPVNLLEMSAQLMFPILFFGNLAFMFSTITRSGNGTAVLMIIIGIALFVVGILVFVYPTQSYLGMSLLFGWLMLISGILEVVLSSVNKHFITGRGWMLAGGIIEIVLGIILIFNVALSAATLPIFLGFWLMLRAFGAIGLGSDMGAMQIAGSGWTIFSGILLLLCSLWILFQPLVFGTTAVIVWVGISLLFAGVAACSLSLQLHRAHRCLGDR